MLTGRVAPGDHDAVLVLAQAPQEGMTQALVVVSISVCRIYKSLYCMYVEYIQLTTNSITDCTLLWSKGWWPPWGQPGLLTWLTSYTSHGLNCLAQAEQTTRHPKIHHKMCLNT
jgi:hypothetical protein